MRKAVPVLLLLISASLPSAAQLIVFDRQALLEYTAQNTFERFADGRPKVPDNLLERLRSISSEDAWGTLNGAGYRHQWEGNWQILHPERRLVGRAVTAQFMPVRPDVNDVINQKAKVAGLARDQNKRVIEILQPGDVVVVDLFGKIEQGTFVGNNLSTAIFSQTGTGMVIDGAIRDLQNVFEIPMAAYFRGVHPTAIGDVMLTGINVPIRVGNVTVMPGDVVMGDREGITFIPPHLVQKIVEQAEATRLRDEFTQIKMREGKYKVRDTYPLNEELRKEFEEWKKKKTTPKP